MLAVAVQVATFGWQFFGDGTIWCAILKLVFVVLAVAVHSARSALCTLLFVLVYIVLAVAVQVVLLI